MDNFAFVIHPLDARVDIARKFKLLGYMPTSLLEFASRFFPPLHISHITGIRSKSTGKEIEGWFVACPLTPRRLMSIPTEVAYNKIVQAGRLAQRLEARLLGLGAFTSVVGDAGVTVAARLQMPVTTGNSYTVAVTVEAVLNAARRGEIDPTETTAAVVGATGAIGRACAQLLVTETAELILVGRSAARLAKVADLVHRVGEARVRTTCSIDAVRDAQIIITATSAGKSFIESKHLSGGAVICDVARPYDVTSEVRTTRDDVLVIDGGMVKVPGEVDFGFDFGFPPRLAYACMAETMILALEGRYESFSLGREISIARVREIAKLAKKHGFHVMYRDQ